MKTPRGQVLIIGGDGVYPTPSREEYKRRLEIPYSYAFPSSNKEDAEHPYVFLLPGNHDWYDGLTLFLEKFCNGKGGRLGSKEYMTSWKLQQSRSYFAVRLPNNWWIWGLDTQLGEDIDRPQADYFTNIAKKFQNESSKNIICSGTPSWISADSKYDEEREYFKRTIDHVASGIIKKYWKDKGKIYAVFSGDSHHYCRYSSDISNTEFVTAGGGGAFLHPTHQLKNNILNVSG